MSGSVAAAITGNSVTGLGPVSYTAQNGIQIISGASATAKNNTASNNFYTGPSYVSCGVLLYKAGGVKLTTTAYVDNQKSLCNYGKVTGNVKPVTHFQTVWGEGLAADSTPVSSRRSRNIATACHRQKSGQDRFCCVLTPRRPTRSRRVDEPMLPGLRRRRSAAVISLAGLADIEAWAPRIADFTLKAAALEERAAAEASTPGRRERLARLHAAVQAGQIAFQRLADPDVRDSPGP